MGCGQSKIHLYPRKSKSKSNGKKGGHVDTDADADEEEGHQDERDKDCSKNDDKLDENSLNQQNSLHDGKGSPEPPNGEIPLPLWWPQLEHRNKGLSSSQQDFFRMLDQKIEEGPDYDSNSEKEAALEDLRISQLLERWESASITASICSSASRSLQNTPVRQQLSLRQHLRNTPQPLSAELLSQQQQLKQQQSSQPVQLPQQTQNQQNSSPKRDARNLLSQTVIHQSYGVTQQETAQINRRYWSMPTMPPFLRMQQQTPSPYMGQYQMQPPQLNQTNPPQLPTPPQQQQTLLSQQQQQQQQPQQSQNSPTLMHTMQQQPEPRFPPAISVQRLAPQVQRQIRETQELIKETCPQRYTAGYGSPGPPMRSQRQPRRNPLETHYSQELS